MARVTLFVAAALISGVHGQQITNITCARPIDIVFLADGSGSVTQAGWTAMMQFVSEFSSDFVWGPQDANMGIIEFDTFAYEAIGLRAAASAADFAAQAAALPFADGRGTATFRAISATTEYMQQNGRPSASGTAYAMIVITDGLSSDTPATIAAADAARAAGITVACVTVGLSGLSPEIDGIVGGDLRLWFPVENWDRLDNANVVLNLTASICGAAATVNNNESVNAQLACNTTQNFRYPSVISPLNIRANVSLGNIVLCYSYVDANPLPLAVLPPRSVLPNTTFCSDLVFGASTIATATAFPVNGSSAGTPLLVPRDLYVSVTAVPNRVTGACGGNFTLRTQGCSVQLATNVTFVGNRSSSVSPNTPLNITLLGSPTDPLCGQCPAGTGQLATSGRLAGICGPRCLGIAQYFSTTAARVACYDCSANCATCIAPGTARSCVTCAPATPQLVLNALDPAFTSPFWTAMDAIAANRSGGVITSARGDAASRSTVAPPVRIAAGRCIATCPVVPGEPAVPRFSTCPLDANTWGARSTGMLVTLAMPTVAGSGLSCDTFASSPANTQMAYTLSLAMGVSLSTIFLRSCLNVSSATRTLHTYNSSYTVPLVYTPINATAMTLDLNAFGGCAVSIAVTYGMDLGAAGPSPGMGALVLAEALTTLTLDTAQHHTRAFVAKRGVTAALDARVYTANCTASAQRGNVPIIVGACLSNSSLTESLLSGSLWSSREVLSLCARPPGAAATPSALPSAFPTTTSTPTATLSVGASASVTAAPTGSATLSPQPSTGGGGGGGGSNDDPAASGAFGRLSTGASIGVSVAALVLALAICLALGWLYRLRSRSSSKDAAESFSMWRPSTWFGASRAPVPSFTLAQAYETTAAAAATVVIPLQPTRAAPAVAENPMNVLRHGTERVAFGTARVRADDATRPQLVSNTARAPSLVGTTSQGLLMPTGPKRGTTSTRALLQPSEPVATAPLNTAVDWAPTPMPR